MRKQRILTAYSPDGTVKKHSRQAFDGGTLVHVRSIAKKFLSKPGDYAVIECGERTEKMVLRDDKSIDKQVTYDRR